MRLDLTIPMQVNPEFWYFYDQKFPAGGPNFIFTNMHQKVSSAEIEAPKGVAF